MRVVTPNGNKLLVLPTKEDRETKEGIITSIEEDEVKSEGVIVEVGSGKEVKEVFVKGQMVMYGRFAGDVIMIEGIQHRIMRDIEVLATFKEV